MQKNFCSLCDSLDTFLRRRNIGHPVVMPVMRNMILLAAIFLLAGCAAFTVLPWLFWFGIGFLCMTWIFWNWARFFLRMPLGKYSSAFLRAVILRFGGHFLGLAFLLYVILALCRAPVPALLAGFAAGTLMILIGYALNFSGKA